MTTAVAAVAAAGGAAVCYGVASAAQHVVAGRTEQHGGALNPVLLARLAAQPVWVATWLAEVVAVLLQALALRLGSVPLVQAVIVGGLPVAVLLRTRALPAGRDLLGLLLTCAGIALVVTALPDQSAASSSTSFRHGLAAVILVVLAVVGLVGAGEVARGRGRGDLDALCAGTAAGICVGAGAIPLALAVRRLPDLLAVLSSWPPWLAAAAGVGGLLLSQAAFQRGAIAAPLAALTLAEPVTGAVLSSALLRVPVASGPPGAALVAFGALAAGAGVVLLALATSPPAAPAS